MMINGTIVDIKTYETKKGKVINLHIREDPACSLIFHIALWRDSAERIGGQLQVGDAIRMSGYAARFEQFSGQITVENFNLIEVKRPVVVSEEEVKIADPHKETGVEGETVD